MWTITYCLVFLDHLIIGESISMFSDRVQQLWSCNLAKWNLITCLILEMTHPLSPSPSGNISVILSDGINEKGSFEFIHYQDCLPAIIYLPLTSGAMLELIFRNWSVNCLEELLSPPDINLNKMLTNLSIIISVQHTEERQHWLLARLGLELVLGLKLR